jgi:CubicO group peptidase (beta-lactamase class C family)
MKALFSSVTLFVFLIASAFAAAPLPLASPSEAGFDPERLGRVQELVRGHVESGRHAGAIMLIARHGKVVDWQAWGTRDIDSGAPMEKDTICRIYSMTKVVACVAALQLFEQGRLRLDAPVTEWLPELSDLKVFTGGTAEAPQLTAATNRLTLRMLLNHTGGFTYDFYSGSPVHELYKQADLWNSDSLDQFLTKVARLPLMAQPGTAYHYGIGNDVLGVLVERVSGLKFEEYIERHITGPLGMRDTFFHVPKEKLPRLASLHQVGSDGRLRTAAPILGAYAEPGRGIPSGGAGLFSTIGDYARFAQCLLNGGELDGVRILGRKTVELALLNSLPPGAVAFHPADRWGLFSGLREDPSQAGEPVSAGTFFWSGAATTHFFADPREGLLALVFSQHIPFDQHGLFTRFRTTVNHALK